MQALLYSVAVWLIREVVVKSAVIASVYTLLVYLVPIAVGYVTPFASAGGLSSLFAAIPDGVYFFLLAFRFDVGLPLVISAYVARFLIRRIPVIG